MCSVFPSVLLIPLILKYVLEEVADSYQNMEYIFLILD